MGTHLAGTPRRFPRSTDCYVNLIAEKYVSGKVGKGLRLPDKADSSQADVTSKSARPM
jgi:hypothetical protein